MKTVLTVHTDLTNYGGIAGMLSGLRGDASGVTGNVEGLIGDVTGITGNLSGLRGSLDDCELSADDRAAGVDVATLLADGHVQVLGNAILADTASPAALSAKAQATAQVAAQNTAGVDKSAGT